MANILSAIKRLGRLSIKCNYQIPIKRTYTRFAYYSMIFCVNKCKFVEENADINHTQERERERREQLAAETEISLD